MGVELKRGDVHLWSGRRCIKSKLLTDSRRLIYSVLSNYIPAEGLKIKKTGFGKPVIYNQHGVIPIKFSLSHCRDLAVMAVAKECEVGVDCEAIHPKSNLDELSEFYLSDEEKKLFHQSVQPLEKRRRFYQYWTLKEAYLKALGCGLHYPFKKIEFLIEDGHSTKRINHNIQVKDCASQHGNNSPDFGLYSLGDHQVAIAVLNTKEKIDYKIFTISEVTQYASESGE